jgi:preprotein translocase subunit SecA
VPDPSLADALGALRRELGAAGMRRTALVRGLALVREVACRALGERPSPTQLAAAHVALAGDVAELESGEGPGLALAIAAALAGLAGLRAHVAAATDAEAEAACQPVRALYTALGLTAAAWPGDGELEPLPSACDVLYLSRLRLRAGLSGALREKDEDAPDGAHPSDPGPRARSVALLLDADLALLGGPATRAGRQSHTATGLRLEAPETGRPSDPYRGYLRIGGVAHGAWEVASALRRTRGQRVVRIPPRQTSLRAPATRRIYAAAPEQERALVERARQAAAQGRPVWIGVTTRAAAERIGAALAAGDVVYGRLPSGTRSADVDALARAGRSGIVTLAAGSIAHTADIRLTPSAARSGGLHVIGAELGGPARTRLLEERAACRGEPGTSEWLVSLDERGLARLPSAVRAMLRGLCAGGRALPAPLTRALLWLARDRRRLDRSLQDG